MKTKILEWIYRIVLFTILQSFITVISFVGIHYSIIILEEANKLTLGVQIGLIQMALASAFIQIANIFYWIMDINLFDFKKLWRNKK